MVFDDFDNDDKFMPQEIDLGWDDDDEDTVPCPNCGKWIHEDAALCPHCRQFVISDVPATYRSRGWFWPVMVAFIIAIILVMWHGLGR